MAGALFRRARRKYKLGGKAVVITGGSRGLGLVMAREFLRRGARVALLARDSGELKRAAADLKSWGNRVITVTCDVTRREQVERALDQIRQELGQIDVLVNNAGTINVGPMDTMNIDDYRQSLEVHFWGPLYTTLAVLPEMRQRHDGRVVNISSIGGKISVPHLLPYSVGKFALAGFSEGLRAEVIKENVYVTSVYPGLMRTGSPRNANFKGKHKAEYAWFSVSGSLPGVSMDADRAGKKIVDACERGDSVLIISLPAKVAVRLHELFPRITSSILGGVNSVLPEAGGIGAQSAKGKDSASVVSPSWVTTLNEKAAEKNNEVA
jgi:short-subunit dehydrogenase